MTTYSANSGSGDPESPGRSVASPRKVVIAGGLGAGKTTFVRSISDIEPLTTETTSARPSVPGERVTTLGLDFGRVALNPDAVLYLFGAPEQARFWFMWGAITHGAVGAVVLVDPRHLADCFSAIDFYEEHDVPYVVAINRFNGVETHGVEAVREALTVRGEVPIVTCDARDAGSAKAVLTSLLEHVRRSSGTTANF